jgi:hypothetical protein
MNDSQNKNNKLQIRDSKEATCANFAQVQTEGNRQVTQYKHKKDDEKDNF